MSAWRRRTAAWTEVPEERLWYEDEETQALAQGLAELPVTYRTVLHLYYYEGLTAEEIGQLQHIPAGTVRMQLSRGRKLLREKLEGGTEDAGIMENAISKFE